MAQDEAIENPARFGAPRIRARLQACRWAHILNSCHPDRSERCRVATVLAQWRDLLSARNVIALPANSRSLHSALTRLGRDDTEIRSVFGTTKIVPCYKALN